MRQVVAWLTLVLFGTVSLLGQGLHALVGCHPVTHRAVGEQSGKTAACGCFHVHPASATKSDQDDPPGSLLTEHDDDCLICRFLAQARELVRPTLPPCVHFVRPHYAAVVTRLPLPPAQQPYQARAPPAIS